MATSTQASLAADEVSSKTASTYAEALADVAALLEAHGLRTLLVATIRLQVQGLPVRVYLSPELEVRDASAVWVATVVVTRGGPRVLRADGSSVTADRDGVMAAMTV